MEEAALGAAEADHAPSMTQILYLALIALTTTAVSVWLAARLPEGALGGQPVITESIWVILLVTSISLALSMTCARALPGAQPIATAIIYVLVASAANIGGAASAPVVAAHHRQSLVPASILMALIGYAVGNYLAILTGRLAQLIGT